ncbi:MULTISPECIES: cupredoxin domain-containing protein [unclassified Mycobacterium]|uniref:cupredoxin domain-containing protein n=1 Tax=Mycobacterium sp. DL99 TaxID=2528957 RepID=UPI0010817AED|nr:cupredoxin family copper-binding protein [Mycobacterium sp. DL99]
MVRRFPTSAVIAALVATASACSSTPPTAPPTVDFGGGTSVGMAPMHEMAPMSPAAPMSTAPAPVAGTAVSIDNFAFAPATLTVHRGDTVTWTNHDEEPHTVAAGDGSFRSPGMGANATFSFTFTNPGSYDYICSIHPVMHGTVVVTP